MRRTPAETTSKNRLSYRKIPSCHPLQACYFQSIQQNIVQTLTRTIVAPLAYQIPSKRPFLD
ncbi:hypothetical protein [Rubritalea tangerina]|uniref:hypothetical protein n=1 Tax=Rubritalea tangerina TaxID=430798 RepID=UPI00361A95B1